MNGGEPKYKGCMKLNAPTLLNAPISPFLSEAKCDKEISFIFQKPILIPDYSMKCTKSCDDISKYQTKFQAKFNKFKETYKPIDDEDIKKFFNKKTANNDPEYLHYLHEIRKRFYFKFKNASKKININPTNKLPTITNAIINNIISRYNDTRNQSNQSNQSNQVEIMKNNEIALNILNYENLLLHGNISTRLNKYDKIIVEYKNTINDNSKLSDSDVQMLKFAEYQQYTIIQKSQESQESQEYKEYLQEYQKKYRKYQEEYQKKYRKYQEES